MTKPIHRAEAKITAKNSGAVKSTIGSHQGRRDWRVGEGSQDEETATIFVELE
jgi:hypothetical protein